MEEATAGKTYENLRVHLPWGRLNWRAESIPGATRAQMTSPQPPNKPERAYPKFYERAVPLAVGLLALIILGMLIYTIGVALGIITGV